MSAQSATQMALIKPFDFDVLCRYWAENHTAYVECLRAHALRILDRNRCETYPNGRVTIDDVRDEITALKLPMPEDINVDQRVFGSILRACKELRPVGVEQTRRADWAKRVGRTRSMITVYERVSA